MSIELRKVDSNSKVNQSQRKLRKSTLSDKVNISRKSTLVRKSSLVRRAKHLGSSSHTHHSRFTYTRRGQECLIPWDEEFVRGEHEDQVKLEDEVSFTCGRRHWQKRLDRAWRDERSGGDRPEEVRVSKSQGGRGLVGSALGTGKGEC